ncbi:MAG TPA: UvrD-helicase domain-containing protein [Parcubacteria group bacterium]|nr:UvrD-helicase domain-containing protein [Parcubacteria group bacterium]
MATLNERQQQAVDTLEGPLLILAGAGAGKTKTIAERIRNLVKHGVTPSSILAITFTNKAAKEMRERVEKMLLEDTELSRPITMTEKPFVSTFHSLGVHILKENSQTLGISRHFTIFDKDDAKRAIKEALVNTGFDPKTHEPDRILSIISKEKGRDTTSEEYMSHEEGGHFASTVKSVWGEYEKILKRDSALDFDDLLLKTVRLLRGNPKVRDYYRQVWKYIHIDEYQDTNKVQYEIAKLLTSEEKNITVVGDIDQNIYSWRGADIQNILKFEKDYPETKIILLEENYRSTKTILEAANTIIKKNKIRVEKNLFTQSESGEKISLLSTFDEISEAEFIATKAKSLIAGGESADEIAVLYRANFQSRVLEEAFLRHQVPYQLLGTRFFERREVKDIISYLRAGLNPGALADVKRIINTPTRGIGKTTVAKIFAGDETTLPAGTRVKIADFRKLLADIGEKANELKPSEVINHIIKSTGLEAEWRGGRDEDQDRLENAFELVAFASRYDHLPQGEGIENFLKDAALQSDQDDLDRKKNEKENKNGVRLMTIHASKGLEFNVVFISGLEDGLFPHNKITRENITAEEREEERRLFYVAVTRARKKLFLTNAQVRTVFGQRETNLPSEFIFDVPEELTEEEVWNEGSVPRRDTRRDILYKIDF